MRKGLEPKCMLLIFCLAFVCILKAFFCSVTFGGGDVVDIMTADYWNFAREIVAGKRLYIDLVDHKGLYLYLLYVPLVLVKSVAAVPVVETAIFSATILSFVFVMYRVHEDLALSLKMGVCYATSYFFLTMTVSLLNTEGLIVPLSILLYFYAAYAKVRKKIHFFLIGIVVGFFFCIKYSCALYFIYPFLFLAVRFFQEFKTKNSLQKSAKDFTSLVFFGLLGFAVSVFPAFVLLYRDKTLPLYLSYMSSASHDSAENFVVFAFAFAVSAFFFARSVFLRKNSSFAIAMMFLSIVGGTFQNRYMAVFLTFAHLAAFAKPVEKEKVANLVCLAVVLVFMNFWNDKVFFFEQYLPPHTTMKSIQEKYGMTNENTLYCTEDVGYGVYSDELFAEPLQWVPSRFLYDEEKKEEILSLYKERILEKRFEFVVGYKGEGNANGDAFDSFWGELFPLIEENYDLLSDASKWYVNVWRSSD